MEVTPQFESWKPASFNLKKARSYADEVAWLFREALKLMGDGDCSCKHRALLALVRGKMTTAQQFADMAVRNLTGSPGQTGATNYTWAPQVWNNYIGESAKVQ